MVARRRARRVHGARPRPRRADDGPRRERRRRRPARQARAGARATRRPINHALTRPEMVEAEATGRAARLAEYTGASLFVVHVTCAAAAAEIEAAQQRGARRHRRDLHAVPRQHDRRPAPARASRAAATSARRRCATRPTTSRCGTTCAAACSRASRPTTARSTTSRRRRGLDNFSLVPNGLPVDPAPPGQAVGRGRRRRAGSRRASSSTAPARRSRAASACDAKGAIAPGKDADVVVFDPARPGPTASRPRS